MEISLECIRLRKAVVQPVNDRYLGPLDRSTVQNTAYPLVLLLGNHSSGKSSFVNWLLKRDVQVSGVAPTDDGFTVIGPGLEDVDRAGPALLGDPDLGFSGLRLFGPMLEHRTQLKLRTNIAATDFMLVDTPGMIDSPGGGDGEDRGYDFEGVCRWYAERADVILLFFDPDKPGTTGETLQVLTNSLAGLDYKLHIILNKADQFSRMHDFARAYGSLCWNLSKVIPRKDLPQIHTMCLPVTHAHAPRTPSVDGHESAPTFLGINMGNLGFPALTMAGNGSGADSSQGRFLAQGLLDLEAARAQVEKEVFNAPKRRVDNEISRLADSVQSLLMHARIVDDVSSRYQEAVFQHRMRLTGCVVGFSALAFLAGGLMLPSSNVGASKTSSAPADPTTRTAVAAAATAAIDAVGAPTLSASIRAALFTSAVGVATTGVLAAVQSHTLALKRVTLCSAAGFGETFARLYARAIAEKDAFTSNLWESVLPPMLLSVTPDTLPKLPRVKPADLQLLERVLSEDVANLRRKAFAPSASAPGSTGESPPFREASESKENSPSSGLVSPSELRFNQAGSPVPSDGGNAGEGLELSPVPTSARPAAADTTEKEGGSRLTPVLLTPARLTPTKGIAKGEETV